MSSNQTIYVQNLDDKIKLDELRRTLYSLFSSCGAILDINARKTQKFRGQAWIVFDDIAAATKAVQLYNGAPFYGKPLKLQFARTKSHLIAKADGTYVAPTPAQLAAAAGSTAGSARAGGASLKRAAPDALGPASVKSARAAGAAPGAQEEEEEEEDEVEAPPNKVLFAERIPAQLTSHMLERFFANAAGFAQVRMDAARPGVAFVEFDTAENATTALNGLQGYKLTPEHTLKLSYAR